MARPKYQITTQDYFAARRWLDNKQKHKHLDYTDPAACRSQADEELGQFPLVHKPKKIDVENLQAWCEKYLSNSAWRQMKTSIKAARIRGASGDQDKKQITLDYQAWRMLSAIAEAENVTLSQVVEKHLHKAYHRAIGIGVDGRK